MDDKRREASRKRPRRFALLVGSRLAERRRGHRWTQKEVAVRAGTSTMRLSRIENGHVQPTLEEAVRLAQAFGTTLDELLLGKAGEREALLQAQLQPIGHLTSEEEFRTFSRLLEALGIGLQILQEAPR